MKPDVSLVIPSKMAESLGVPGANTSTTNTLTPTTLRTITQIFESDECLNNLRKFDETGGAFVPPPVTTCEIKVPKTQSFVTNSWQGGTTTVVTPSKVIFPATSFAEIKQEETEEKQQPMNNTSTSTRRSSRLAGARPAVGYHRMAMMDEEESMSPPPAKVSKRTGGGRKPAKGRRDEELTPEEEERVKVRRVRNKEAAARCRKRRVDLTNSLMKEVEAHEAKKQILEEEIQLLKGQKEELEFILQAHTAHCQLGIATTTTTMQQEQIFAKPAQPMVAVKSEPVLVESVNAPYIIPSTINPVSIVDTDIVQEMERPPKRPMSLTIPDKSSPKEIQAGIVIETPTSNIPCLAFDTVTSGLTPCGPIASIVTPIITPTLNTPTNCSSQQRSSESNNMSNNSPDYVSL